MRGSKRLCSGWINHALLLFLTIWWQPTFCHPASTSPIIRPGFSNQPLRPTNTSLSTIPLEFNVERDIFLSIDYTPESCFVNIIAALHQAALGDFRGKMIIANYRTTRFHQPLIAINVPDSSNRIARKYVIWGLFLSAQYLHISEGFSQSFFTLRYKEEEVGGIGIGTGLTATNRGTTTTTVNDPAVLQTRNINVDFEFYDTTDLGKDAIFMTIIGALVNAAPPISNNPIQQTWASFQNDQPVVFVAVPVPAARSLPPFLTYEDVILVLARAAEYFVAKGKYCPLKMDIHVSGFKVAEAAFALKSQVGNANYTGTSMERLIASI
ncbi:MAG: hypothetical protein Q9170_005048 [Blastenia crenularia]